MRGEDMKDFLKKVDFYRLSVKYWLQGDDWGYATWYAGRLVYGFKAGYSKRG